MSTPNIIAIVNQKGGVGKTTTSVNLATALSAVGKKILVVDADPQGNASTGFGIEQASRTITLYDVLINEIPIDRGIIKTFVPNLHLLSSTMDLSGAEIEMVSLEKREFLLQNAFNILPAKYDYVIIDCPPSLGLLTLNALTAAHEVLIPLQCEFYALEGLAHLLKTINLVQKHLNKQLSINGVVLTMYDKRNKTTEHIEAEVRDYFKQKVYQSTIPRNVRMSEAPSHGKPAVVYDMHCAGSKAYLKLAREFLQREKHTEQTSGKSKITA